MKLLVPPALRRTRPLVLALALSGCAVGPDYRSPPLAHSDHFAQAEAVARAHLGSPVPADAGWWAGFHDPVLERVLKTTAEQNLDMAQADARITEARAGTKAAFAALIPSATVSADAARSHQSLEDPLGRVEAATPNFNRNSNYYDADLNVGWELDIFGGRRRELEASRADYEAAKAGKAAVQLAVTAAAADTYVLVRTLQARIALVHDQIQTQQDRVRLIGLLQERGVAPQARLDEAKGVLAGVAAVEPELQINLVSARNALDVLMGQSPGTPDADLDAPGPIPTAPEIATATGPADLVRRRPDLVVAERQLASSNAKIGAALADYYPRFSLSGLLGSATTFNGHLFNDAANQSEGVLGLRWRLFDFGRIDAEVKQARGRNAEALAAYRQSVFRATGEVENALAAVVNRDAQQKQLTDGEESLTRARVAVLAAYQSGASSYIDLLDVDTRVQQIQDARLIAQSNAARAAIDSFRALGGGWSSSLADGPDPIAAR